ALLRVDKRGRGEPAGTGLYPALPGDERPLERLLRLQPGWLLARRRPLHRRLQEGVRARLPPRPRRSARSGQRETPPPRTAGCPCRRAGRELAVARAGGLEPAGLRQSGPPREQRGSVLPGRRLRGRGRERPL